MNFVPCGQTSILLTFMCSFTVEATRARHAEGGIKVREEGNIVEYCHGKETYT